MIVDKNLVERKRLAYLNAGYKVTELEHHPDSIVYYSIADDGTERRHTHTKDGVFIDITKEASIEPPQLEKPKKSKRKKDTV
jgi:hypothetical protein